MPKVALSCISFTVHFLCWDSVHALGPVSFWPVLAVKMSPLRWDVPEPRINLSTDNTQGHSNYPSRSEFTSWPLRLSLRECLQTKCFVMQSSKMQTSIQVFSYSRVIEVNWYTGLKESEKKKKGLEIYVQAKCFAFTQPLLSNFKSNLIFSLKGNV